MAGPSAAPEEGWWSDAEIVARVERQRKWIIEEKAALITEEEAEGGEVTLVARRHRISENLLDNRRPAWKAVAAAAVGSSGSVEFAPLGVLGEAGSCVSVDAFVNEKALSQAKRSASKVRRFQP